MNKRYKKKYAILWLLQIQARSNKNLLGLQTCEESLIPSLILANRLNLKTCFQSINDKISQNLKNRIYHPWIEMLHSKKSLPQTGIYQQSALMSSCMQQKNKAKKKNHPWARLSCVCRLTEVREQTTSQKDI